MIKETVTYKDYNDVERTEDFYFHMTKAEVVEKELSTPGGYVGMLNKIIAAQDSATLVKTFKEFVIEAYGVKSADGRGFDKSPEVKQAFLQHPAFSEIYMKLAFNAEAAAKFVNGVIPKNIDITAYANGKPVTE